MEDRYCIQIIGKWRGEWTALQEHYEDTADGAKEYMDIDNIIYTAGAFTQYEELQFVLWDDSDVYADPLQTITVHFTPAINLED